MQGGCRVVANSMALGSLVCLHPGGCALGARLVDRGDAWLERRLLVFSGADLGPRQHHEYQHDKQHPHLGGRGWGVDCQVGRVAGLHLDACGERFELWAHVCIGAVQHGFGLCDLDKLQAEHLHRQQRFATEQLHRRAQLHDVGQHQREFVPQSLSQLF